MSLIGALNAGQTGLATAQAAIQVTSNNIANAGNADYTRQTAETAPLPDQQISQGIFVGTGVDLTSIQRQIDDALTARLRSSISDNQAASTTQQWLSQVQSVFNALGTSNLSTSMSNFFSAWSNLANKPQDMGLRQVVISQGQSLAQTFSSQVTQLQSLNTSASASMTQMAQNADNLASQVASLNRQIVVAEGGSGGTANGLRDQRDAVLKQLSQLMNVTTVQQPDGAVDVYVGSEALVSNT
ncbi:MAG TPA: flagellar hook-associated protein FlgK, partial [Tepidisphaeraceae bacterium]|nr:flagellar hook-associated protein FlgK [Tepidisphaeraceae bacterium]